MSKIDDILAGLRKDAWSGYGMQADAIEAEMNALLTRAEEAERELAEIKAILADPEAVYMNILLGRIALPDYYVRTTDTHGEFAKLERELAELRERTRWHLNPADLPEKEYVVIVLLDDGQIKDDLICFNGTWLSNDNVIGWREADFPTPPEPPDAEND